MPPIYFLPNFSDIYPEKLKIMHTKITYRIILILLTYIAVSCAQRSSRQVAEDGFSGSESCIQCHERFYELWASSFHGKAMQPVNGDFVREYGLPESSSMEVEGKLYKIVYEDSLMVMLEKERDLLLKKYPIGWTLGGPNVYTFLTPLEKGRLQTIPLAYDMNRQTWFNYPESAVRHFVDQGATDEALPWKDRMYTFNTGCYNCHVSQVSSNFDPETDTYHTTWKESGINCESCHGPSSEHIRVCLEAGEGNVPDDLKLIVTSTFTQEQHNSSCATCHAKGSPVTKHYVPGELYYDHFNLATLEDPDFYPDGRDLGENYTYTGWKMNACVEASDLHCVTCHTSSGRNRFKDEPNLACISCHSDKQANLTEHTMHEPGSSGSVCINCHAPSREFVGHFIRSDHSFRPPMPEATLRFGSPNACNQCHSDKSAEWANNIVKKRPRGNYQEETLYWAQLIKEARENRWERLDEMLEIISENRYNEVVVASFIRLLANCPEQEKLEAIRTAINGNPSPLVRAAAAAAMDWDFSENSKKALLAAATDKFRLVRISAAASLAGYEDSRFAPAEKQTVSRVTEEYMEAMVARPDDWSSYYNLGIYHQNRGSAGKALDAYETAIRLYPESLMPFINSSVLYSYIGNQAKAEENLKKALEIDPKNEAANLNLGLLTAEQGKSEEAEKALRTVLDVNPKQAVAAYNLSVIVSANNLDEAVRFVKIAAENRPEEPRYAYTLAYYQMENNQKQAAEKTLKELIAKNPQYLNAVSFLADIYMRDGKTGELKNLYEETLKTEGISAQDKEAIRQALHTITGNANKE